MTDTQKPYTPLTPVCTDQTEDNGMHVLSLQTLHTVPLSFSERLTDADMVRHRTGDAA